MEYQVVIETSRTVEGCTREYLEECGKPFPTLEEAATHLQACTREPLVDIEEPAYWDELSGWQPAYAYKYGDYLIRVIDGGRQARIRAEEEWQRLKKRTSPFRALAQLKLPDR